MKKEDITTLGVAEDVADKLLAAFGAEISSANTQRDGWKAKYEAESAAFAAHKSDTALTAALGAYKPRNAALLKKALDTSSLKQKPDGSFDGLEAAVKKLRESDGYLFEPEKAQGVPGALGNPPAQDADAKADAALHALFGYH
jgi:hypothetical protein